MLKNVTISLDMDGTISNLFGVHNWLKMLINNDPTPYTIAKPLTNLSLLARYLNKLQKQGYSLQVISWLAKNSTDEYEVSVTQAKIKWLKKHLPSVHWDNVAILPYGTPKENYCYSVMDVLFDDTEVVRNDWNKKGIAYDEKNILEILKEMLDK